MANCAYTSINHTSEAVGQNGRGFTLTVATKVEVAAEDEDSWSWSVVMVDTHRYLRCSRRHQCSAG